MIISIKKPTNHNFFTFSLLTALIMSVLSAIFLWSSITKYERNNYILLQREAININDIIFNSFDYSNRINSYIGKQIANHGANDLNFIVNLFHEIDKMYLFREYNKIQSKDSNLLSCISFDWVNTQNLQTASSTLGIHKNPLNMSHRQYVAAARQDPWHLKVSFPAFGNPSNIWIIPAGTGITDDNNKFLGIVSLGFNVVEFESKIEQKLGNHNVNFVVLDNDSNIVLQSSSNKLKPDDDFYKRNNFSKKFTKDSGKLDEKISVGHVEFGYYQKMNQYPYIILTGFNKSFLHKEFNNLILPRILEFLAITTFFLMILYLFKTRISLILDKERNLTNSLNLANQSKLNLLRTISHDLHNYIFGISGLAKMMFDRKHKLQIHEDDDSKLLKTIIEQSDEASHFIEDLLDVEQIATGKFNLGKVEECNMEKLAYRVILLSQNLADQNQIKINSQIENNLPSFRCDQRRIKQILINLLNNAIKYSKPDNVVNVIVKNLEDKLYIEISDSGIGMNNEEIQMALNGDGAQIDKSTLAKPIDSHGLGIPIIKHLVDLHHGEIEITSHKNIGTTIKLWFAIEPKICNPKINPDTKIKSSKSILVVEDNSVNALIITNVLGKEGYQTYHAKNGVEALEKLESEPNIDLIVMDGEMPIMNGYDTTKNIRSGQGLGSGFKNFTNKNIPIIALMGNKDDETMRRIKDCGMNEHIEKSSSVVDLIKLIGKYLNH